MKAISLWQPHASLSVLGLKPYETRSWAAWRSLIGKRILIHAAKSLEDLRDLVEYLDDRERGCSPDEVMDAYITALTGAGFATVGDLPRGCIVGSVVLQASVRTEDLSDPGHFGNFAPGRFAWRMVDPQIFSVPIPYRGKQGFFDVPDSLQMEFVSP